LEAGNGVWLKNRSGVSIIVREAANDVERAKLTRSGTCVTDISYLVSNVDELLRNVQLASKTVQNMNVTSTVGRNNNVRFVQLFFPRPGLRHSLFESSDFGLLLDGWKMVPPREEDDANDNADVVSFIDHIAIACLGGTMKLIVEWYEVALALKQKLGVITIKTELGDGLRLASLYHQDESKNETFCQLTFVESVSIQNGDGQNQVTTFLKNHGGPGVQHMAFLTNDIFSARKLLSSRGVQFLSAPPGYYELPHMQAQADAAGLELAKLEEGGILFDNEPENMEPNDADAGNKYLLQVFTRSPFPRNTCFFELITRGNHREGFGAGNIRNLFLAVALERKNRVRNASSNASSTEDEASEDRPELVDLETSLLSPRAPHPARRADVVVVSTTVAGMVTALACARNKISVVLIGNEPPHVDGEVMTLCVGTLHFFRQLGILDDVLKESLELSKSEVQAKEVLSHPSNVWVIDVVALRGLLLRALRSVSEWCEVRLGHQVVALGSMRKAVSVHTEVGDKNNSKKKKKKI
jgi:4-hydroxyphenylpyruvate dioxygenase